MSIFLGLLILIGHVLCGGDRSLVEVHATPSLSFVASTQAPISALGVVVSKKHGYIVVSSSPWSFGIVESCSVVIQGPEGKSAILEAKKLFSSELLGFAIVQVKKLPSYVKEAKLAAKYYAGPTDLRFLVKGYQKTHVTLSEQDFDGVKYYWKGIAPFSGGVFLRKNTEEVVAFAGNSFAESEATYVPSYIIKEVVQQLTQSQLPGGKVERIEAPMRITPTSRFIFINKYSQEIDAALALEKGEAMPRYLLTLDRDTTSLKVGDVLRYEPVRLNAKSMMAWGSGRPFVQTNRVRVLRNGEVLEVDLQDSDFSPQEPLESAGDVCVYQGRIVNRSPVNPVYQLSSRDPLRKNTESSYQGRRNNFEWATFFRTQTISNLDGSRVRLDDIVGKKKRIFFSNYPEAVELFYTPEETSPCFVVGYPSKVRSK